MGAKSVAKMIGNLAMQAPGQAQRADGFQGFSAFVSEQGDTQPPVAKQCGLD